MVGQQGSALVMVEGGNETGCWMNVQFLGADGVISGWCSQYRNLAPDMDVTDASSGASSSSVFLRWTGCKRRSWCRGSGRVGGLFARERCVDRRSCSSFHKQEDGKETCWQCVLLYGVAACPCWFRMCCCSVDLRMECGRCCSCSTGR